MDDYLTKPIEPLKLVECLDRWTRVQKESPGLQREGMEARGKIVFDREDFVSRLGDDPLFLREILDIFSRDVPNRVSLLWKAIEEESPTRIQQGAHTLQGACANVGASMMREVAGRIEVAGQEGDMERTKALLADFQREFGEFREAVGQEEVSWA